MDADIDPGNQRYLKRIPLQTSTKSTKTPTPIGQVGIGANGVPLFSYKGSTTRKYGGLKSITKNSGGDGYAMLRLEDVAASPGSEISVPLILESDLIVAGVQFSVSYTSAIGSYLYPSNLNSMDDCFTANFNDLNGEFIGIIFSLEGCVYPSEESVHIADLVFEVSDNVPSGLEAFLNFTNTLVSDVNGNEILSYGEGANVLFGLEGDANSDGFVNILDVVLIVNFAIYVEEPTDSQFWASDINGDGLINILDIVLIVNLILDN